LRIEACVITNKRKIGKMIPYNRDSRREDLVVEGVQRRPLEGTLNVLECREERRVES
jgi:hypothetical protein